MIAFREETNFFYKYVDMSDTTLGLFHQNDPDLSPYSSAVIIRTLLVSNILSSPVLIEGKNIKVLSFISNVDELGATILTIYQQKRKGPKFKKQENLDITPFIKDHTITIYRDKQKLQKEITNTIGGDFVDLVYQEQNLPLAGGVGVIFCEERPIFARGFLYVKKTDLELPYDKNVKKLVSNNVIGHLNIDSFCSMLELPVPTSIGFNRMKFVKVTGKEFNKFKKTLEKEYKYDQEGTASEKA